MNSHSHPLPSLLVKGWGFALFLLFVSITATAQDIRIKSFERNLMDPGASLAPVKDANGVPCARIRFSVQNRNLKVEPNLGAVKTRRMDGEVWVYVPEGTKKFTLRCGNALPLRDYVIPVKIESKVTYDCVVEITNLKYAFAKERVVYINAGYNAVAISGPSLGVGVSLKRHNFEIGASSRDQYARNHPVDRGNMQRGDLVFFTSAHSGKHVGHVGIVVEVDPTNNTFSFIHASTRNGVIVSRSTDGYYARRFVGVRRVVK